jgi:uncharacterized damage-inducible protein DinB
MADLLECLAQIRALAETAPRLAALVGAADDERWHARPETAVWAPVEVLAHLADFELIYAARLRAMLTMERPQLQAIDPAALSRVAGYIDWPVALALERFRTRRRDTLDLLRRCSAAGLERTGIHPRRGSIDVADLVAGMLAHDTSHVGQIRQRLGAFDEPRTTMEA